MMTETKNPILYPFTIEKADNIDVASVPWSINMVNARAFFPYAEGIRPVGAIIDTGLHTAHQEFEGRIFMPVCFDGSASMSDEKGHGTHVAGTAMGTNVGMIPDGRICPLKVSFGIGETSNQIHNAFIFILDYNKTAPDADKIVAVNCSFDGPVDVMINYYIRALTESGVSVIVAAGNRGDGDATTEECFGYPAFLQEVITTAALNSYGYVAGFSSSFDGIDISAPGVNVLSASPNGGYVNMSGTSMATPHVFGAVLLIKAAFRKKYGRWPTTEETENILWKCVKPLQFDDKLSGRGMLCFPDRVISKEQKASDVAPFIKNNRTFVPLRAIAEGFGATVDGGKLPAVTSELNDKKVIMQIGSLNYDVETKLL